MSQSALRKIEELDEEGMRNFLKTNGMGASTKIFALEKINGKAFLNLSKAEFLRWRKLTFESEVKSVERFLKNVKEHPTRFIKGESTLTRSNFYVELPAAYQPVSDANENSSFRTSKSCPVLQDIQFHFQAQNSSDVKQSLKSKGSLPEEGFYEINRRSSMVETLKRNLSYSPTVSKKGEAEGAIGSKVERQLEVEIDNRQTGRGNKSEDKNVITDAIRESCQVNPKARQRLTIKSKLGSNANANTASNTKNPTPPRTSSTSLVQPQFFGELERTIAYRDSIRLLKKKKYPEMVEEDKEINTTESKEETRQVKSSPKIALETINPLKKPDLAEKPVLPKLEPNTKKSVEKISDYLVPKECQNPTDSTKCYFNMTREEAEVYLKISAITGAYLFRPSTRHYCALSLLFGNEVHHIAVTSTQKDKLELAVNGIDERFESLEAIVNYFKLHPFQATTIQKIIQLRTVIE